MGAVPCYKIESSSLGFRDMEWSVKRTYTASSNCDSHVPRAQGFSVTISAKLSSGVAWDVDLYDRAAPDLGEFVNIGNMEGGGCILSSLLADSKRLQAPPT